MHINWNMNEKDFDEFVLNHPTSHYAKTSMWAKVKKYQENYNVVLSGLYQENKLQATALLLIKKKWGIRYAYIPWGICVDFDNLDLVQEYCKVIRDYAKKHKLAFVKMELNALHDDKSENLIKSLDACGFKHKGFGYGYDGSWFNRFTLIIDLAPSYEDIQSRFTKARHSKINKHNKYSIYTKVATKKQIDVLCRLEKDLADTKGFKPHEPAFFENIIDNFPNNHVYAITTLDIKQSLENIQVELTHKKYVKDIKARTDKEKTYSDLLKLHEKHGDHVDIAAGLFLYDNLSSWDLYLYKCSDFNFINGTDKIHLFMIEEMKRRGVKHYDMVGFSGSTSPEDPYYGLYLYKSSFGSEVVEYVGEFNLVLNPKLKNIFDKTDRLYRKIRRKVHYYLNIKTRK